MSSASAVKVVVKMPSDATDWTDWTDPRWLTIWKMTVETESLRSGSEAEAVIIEPFLVLVV